MHTNRFLRFTVDIEDAVLAGLSTTSRENAKDSAIASILAMGGIVSALLKKYAGPASTCLPPSTEKALLTHGMLWSLGIRIPVAKCIAC